MYYTKYVRTLIALYHRFVDSYQPWLPYTIPTPPKSTLLLLVIYLLALRHIHLSSPVLTSISSDMAQLRDRLLRLFHSHLLSCFLSHPSSLSIGTIQALCILGLWMPYGPEEVLNTPETISIVDMWATHMNMQSLNLSIVKATGLYDAGTVLTQAQTLGIRLDPAERTHLMEKARLVSTFRDK